MSYLDNPNDICASIEISGGLGNQLFQIAMVTHYVNKVNQASSEQYRINVVFKYEEILPSTNNKARKTFWNTLFENQFGFIKDAEEWKKMNFEIIEELDPHSFIAPSYKQPDKSIYFKGLYQSFKYIDDDLRTVMRSHVYNPRYYKVAEKFYNEIKSKFDNADYDDIVTIHVKRKNCISDTYKHYNLGLDYYREALEIAKKPYVVVFSDDINWCKLNIARNLYQYTNIYFVDIGIPEFEFILMSMFKHNIIANSTFSLWASFISPYLNKTVIAPKNWYSDIDSKDCQEIYHKYITYII
jgi:hypothetical protein